MFFQIQMKGLFGLKEKKKEGLIPSSAIQFVGTGNRKTKCFFPFPLSCREKTHENFYPLKPFRNSYGFICVYILIPPLFIFLRLQISANRTSPN